MTDARNVVDVETNEGSPVSNQHPSQTTKKSAYFEVKVPDGTRQNVLGLGIKSDTETVLYLWREGIFLSATEGMVRSEEKCQSGDVICCRLFLDVHTIESQRFHRLSFSINGRVLNRPISLEGNLPISAAIIRDEECEEDDNETELNLGERPFIHSIGKYNLFFVS